MLRLKKSADFLHISKNGARKATNSLVLQKSVNDIGEIRVGFTVSKRVSKLSVERNRIKRRLRAAVKDIFPKKAESGFDYVIIGKVECLTKEFAEIKSDLEYALKKLSISSK